MSERMRRSNDRPRVDRDELRAAWAFLGCVPWKLFLTLTFDPKRVFPVGRERAEREAQQWCNLLGYMSRCPLRWLYAAERSARGHWHVHVLLTDLDEKRIAPALGVWRSRNGNVDVRPVYNGGGAVLYTMKEAALNGEVVISDTITPARYGRILSPAILVALRPDQERGVSPEIAATAVSPSVDPLA